MKSHELDIANFLSSYTPKDVKKGIRLWAAEYVITKGRFKKELSEQGWYPVEKKPKDREFYLIDGQFWVQDEVVRKKLEEKAYKKFLEFQRKKGADISKYERILASSKKTDLSEIKKTELKCPICNAELFKQAICPGCAEGKKGYKIRLICGEDADHEFLV